MLLPTVPPVIGITVPPEFFQSNQVLDVDEVMTLCVIEQASRC
jgi:hypothetical protein